MLRISEFILNSCWQIVVISAAAAVGSWILKNGPARYQHALWVVALAVSLVVPLLSTTHFIRMPTRSAVAIQSKDVAPIERSSDAGDSGVDRLRRRNSQPISTNNQTALFLALGYVLFLLGRTIRLTRFWLRQKRLRRSATHVGLSEEVQTVAERCRVLLDIKNVVVACSVEARLPYTLGARRPLIVLPEAFCRPADEAQLASIVGHEMAHVARRDFLTNLVCELVALPISFHPLTFWIKRQIARTRELSCDELVTKHVLAPRVYARSLLWAADVTSEHASQAFILSIFDARSLEERIMRLTRNRKSVGSMVARVMMLVALCGVVVSAMPLTLFSFELQTQAQVRFAQQNAPSAEERAVAACNAGHRGDVEAIPMLIAQLADDTRVQFVKCWESGRWSPALETFKRPSPGEQAAIALASFGRTSLGPLSNQLDSQNATVRRNAAWAIGELTSMLPGERSSAVPQLITLLGDSDEWVRMAAARALGELRDERALARLIATLSDENWRVRELVVWALSEMKDDRAVTALCNVLLSDVRVEVRRGAAEALGEIRSAEALPYLKQALHDSSAGVSAKAAWAISEIEG